MGADGEQQHGNRGPYHCKSKGASCRPLWCDRRCHRDHHSGLGMSAELRIFPEDRIGGLTKHGSSRAIPHPHTPLRRLLEQIANSAVSGFGFALGRDIYRVTKAGLRFAFVAAVPFMWVLLPWMSGYLMRRNRGYLDVAIGLLAAVVGYAACLLVAFIVLFSTTMAAPVVPGQVAFFAAAGAVFAAFYFFGVRAGSLARERDETVRLVASHNNAFLVERGIKETGGRDITHYDGEGNALRYIETHYHQMLFMVVGRRGRRASILLDSEGRMVRYSGA